MAFLENAFGGGREMPFRACLRCAWYAVLEVAGFCLWVLRLPFVPILGSAVSGRWCPGELRWSESTLGEAPLSSARSSKRVSGGPGLYKLRWAPPLPGCDVHNSLVSLMELDMGP